MEIAKSHLFIPKALGTLDVKFKSGEFYIAGRCVERANISSELRGISKDKFVWLVEQGYLAISQTDAQEYKISYKGRIMGAGPVLALTAGLLCKAVGVGLLFVPGGQAAGVACIAAAPAVAAAAAFVPAP